jgi:hypothetical protein
MGRDKRSLIVSLLILAASLAVGVGVGWLVWSVWGMVEKVLSGRKAEVSGV